MHADEERSVTAGLEESRVLGPLLLDHELAIGIEQIRQQGVEGVVAARAVAVHDDDLGRARRLRPAHGGVDLLRV